MNKSLPTRTLREQPDLDQLKRQAKELLQAFRSAEADAVAEVTAHYREADAATFALHDAQLVLARAYGFDSWPKLKAYVDGVTIVRLAEVVRSGDVEQARAMLSVRPELARMCIADDDEHLALHYAVIARQPEIVRLLLEHGADPRQGIYPHRDATTALTLATERGYDEIVAILRTEQRKVPETPHRDTGHPPLPHSLIARALLAGGAELTAPIAVMLGKGDWLRAQHAAGKLENPMGDGEGLLSIAVQSNRPDILALLLELGLDPDEHVLQRGQDEVPFYTSGGALYYCACSGKHAMAEMLLTRGADPNLHVYASGPPLYKAYEARDTAMVALLEKHGGVVDASTAGCLRLTDKARQLLEDEAAGRVPKETHGPTLLFYACDGGDPEIVRMALERIDWPKEDPRWHGILVRSLGDHALPDRERHAACFGQVLDHCDPSIPAKSGRTILHDLAAGWPHPCTGPEERLALATMVLDRKPRLNIRDDLLRSTPLGWACRWGRTELVRLLLERGADAVEMDAEPWATPLAWAEKMKHGAIVNLLKAAIR